MGKTYTSPGQFADVAKVLDTAMVAGGGLYRLPTPGKAIHWRQRAYGLRTLLHKIDARMKGASGTATSPYDTMILRIMEDDPCVVRIEVRQPEGELTTLGGTAVVTKAETRLIDDPFLDEVQALVNEKGV